MTSVSSSYCRRSGEYRDGQCAIITERESRIESDLPGVSVEISEVASVSTVESVFRNTRDGATRRYGGVDDVVDLMSMPNVVGKRDTPKATDGALLDTGISGQLVSVPEHDGDASGLEEDGLFDLLPTPPQALIEQAGTTQIGDTEGDETQTLFHKRNKAHECQQADVALRPIACV